MGPKAFVVIIGMSHSLPSGKLDQMPQVVGVSRVLPVASDHFAHSLLVIRSTSRGRASA